MSQASKSLQLSGFKPLNASYTRARTGKTLQLNRPIRQQPFDLSWKTRPRKATSTLMWSDVFLAEGRHQYLNGDVNSEFPSLKSNAGDLRSASASNRRFNLTFEGSRMNTPLLETRSVKRLDILNLVSTVGVWGNNVDLIASPWLTHYDIGNIGLKSHVVSFWGLIRETVGEVIKNK